MSFSSAATSIATEPRITGVAPSSARTMKYSSAVPRQTERVAALTVRAVHDRHDVGDGVSHLERALESAEGRGTSPGAGVVASGDADEHLGPVFADGSLGWCGTSAGASLGRFLRQLRGTSSSRLASREKSVYMLSRRTAFQLGGLLASVPAFKGVATAQIPIAAEDDALIQAFSAGRLDVDPERIVFVSPLPGVEGDGSRESPRRDLITVIAEAVLPSTVFEG